MFINDLPLYVNSNKDMYADDSTIHTSARTVEELNNKLTEDMTNVQAWCTYNNNMVINDGKTKAMMITTSQRATTLNSNLRVEFNGVQLKNTNSEKILGVVMNEHLSSL
jgi:phage host-nuclease inhibitor protein Gam